MNEVTDEMVNRADSILSRSRAGISDETIRLAISAALSVAPSFSRPVCDPAQTDKATGAILSVDVFPGMTLRDWFAGHALAGITASLCSDVSYGDRVWFSQTAQDAYKLADAMIAARKAGA